ncbi:hypothetical protein PoB_006670900 [Plakobranchus ocellatus]|uniref:Uncharacterized protein n=1 Tax=Plakobranchus ocellatus TaxID=259542 RepID=A0AAV4D7N4_9GAST|nr:hypothetical protein PoB_006670900 [Plakobranchus ocellatus]
MSSSSNPRHPQQSHFKLSGAPSRQSAGGEARTRQKCPCRSQGGFAIHCATVGPLDALFDGAEKALGAVHLPPNNRKTDKAAPPIQLPLLTWGKLRPSDNNH